MTELHTNGARVSDTSTFSETQETISALMTGLKKIIKGRDDTIRLVLTALFADGHVLLEDYPGSGKTTLTKSLGMLIGPDLNGESRIAPFKRIQFTPDMLPGDILGVNIFEPGQGSFKFVPGPVFAHVVLADEINRTGPKVQAAFLECMAEKQVTIDNQTYPLDDFFFVIGTQNPLDIAGTYPLPLVQLDRFLLRIPMSYVNADVELEILKGHDAITRSVRDASPVCTRSDILKARAVTDQVTVNDAIRETIVAITQATRGNPALQFGASTRAAIMFQAALKAWALVNGREYCIEDDVKTLAPYVLGHRLRFHSNAGDPKAALENLMAPHLERLIARPIS